MKRSNIPSRHIRQTGFTLVEMSVVLVVIALIVGAVTIGRDVYRSAVTERISSEFIQGWLLAYDNYVAGVGTVPGDNFAAPTGRVNGAVNSALCGTDLRTAMLARGIGMPNGRAVGFESNYVYLDSHGLPQNLEVCFINANWSEPGAIPDSYVVRQRNLMRLSGLTPEMANSLDSRIDGRIDARFGRVREVGRADDVGLVPERWNAEGDRQAIGGAVSNNDTTQVVRLNGYVRMNQ